MISQHNALPFCPGEQGIWLDLPAETYHHAPGCSHSMLKNIEPPARLPVYLSEKREPTAAMILGTLTHHHVLEPHKPLPKIVVPPETYPAPADCTAVKQKKAQPGDALPWHWSAKFCKEWAAKMEERGEIILTEAEFKSVVGMAASIATHPLCREIFFEGWSEVSVFKNSVTSPTVLRKMRCDWVPKHGNALVDVKTCTDASDDALRHLILKQGYHSQAAYYLELWNDAVFESDEFTPREHFVFVFVEKKPPYLVAVKQLDVPSLERGHAVNSTRIETYGKCVEAKQWPGFSPEIESIGIPDWAHKRNRNDIVAILEGLV